MLKPGRKVFVNKKGSRLSRYWNIFGTILERSPYPDSWDVQTGRKRNAFPII